MYNGHTRARKSLPARVSGIFSLGFVGGIHLRSSVPQGMVGRLKSSVLVRGRLCGRYRFCLKKYSFFVSDSDKRPKSSRFIHAGTLLQISNETCL